ncbi:MAG: hypothetical protein ACRDL6_00030 [Solirubrobacterales bacterium]
MQRYTFVVQVHPEGISTLENLSTHERVRIAGPAEVGPLIEKWLEASGQASADAGSAALPSEKP